jgi:hypothetical protein
VGEQLAEMLENSEGHDAFRTDDTKVYVLRELTSFPRDGEIIAES